jgi:acetyl-CoA carboxylase biotin carboxyl carrier protein
MLSNLGGSKVDELVVRKGDFTMVLRAGGAAGGLSATASAALSGPGTAPAAAEVAVRSEAAPKAEQAAAPAPQPAAESPAAPAPEPVAPAAYKDTIKAPLGGTFYVAGGPGKPAFVNVGDTVKAGQKVCVVEAMKLFNEITAAVDCRIVAILVTNGTAVTKDQPLVGVDPL